jgi:LmbE family N-acetylglucosaminyl deacetylase
MLGFDFGKHDRPIRFLFLGAHCDDIEIGCSGTLLRLVDAYPRAEFHWATLASDPVRAQETEKCAHRLLGNDVTRSVQIDSFRESHFPTQMSELKERIEELKVRTLPDVVFTHHREDRHQDHRTLSDLTWNSFRDHIVLEYEIPKFDGDLGSPNFFVPIPEPVVQQKIDALLECFPSQRDRYWFTEETFRGMMRIRGIEARSHTGYAEGFYARKITLQA